MNMPFDFLSFSLDSFLIMLSWLFLAISFFPWGKLFSKIMGIKIKGTNGLIVNIWLGFSFCIFVFLIYHLFLPINVYASSLFYIPSFIYFFIKYWKKIPSFIKSLGWSKILIIILTLFAASTIAIQLPSNGDTGLYHLNTIRWENEYPIIKGLGCLNRRLAFNMSFFLYSASLNFYPFLKDYAFHVSNTFLYALFFVGLFLRGSIIDLIIIALYFIIPMPYHWMNSPTPDIASTIIQIIAFRYFIDTIYYKTDDSERSSNIAFVAILTAILITVKLSNAVFVAGLGLVTLLFSKIHKFKDEERKKIKKAFVFISLLFTIWIIRGYIQTGYPLFPSSIGKINFPWTVPHGIAQLEMDIIYAGTRSCGTILDKNSPMIKNYAWLGNWFRTEIFDKNSYLTDDYISNFFILLSLFAFPETFNNWFLGSVNLLILSILLFPIWINSLYKKNKTLKNNSVMFSILVVEIISILFWFFVAPSPRFANGIFIILFITMLLPIVERYSFITSNIWLKQILLYYSLVMFIWNLGIGYCGEEFYINGMIKYPVFKMQTKTSLHGVKVYLPIERDVEIGDSNLLASNYIVESLALLGKDISEGFCIKGAGRILYRYSK